MTGGTPSPSKLNFTLPTSKTFNVFTSLFPTKLNNPKPHVSTITLIPRPFYLSIIIEPNNVSSRFRTQEVPIIIPVRGIPRLTNSLFI